MFCAEVHYPVKIKHPVPMTKYNTVVLRVFSHGDHPTRPRTENRLESSQAAHPCRSWLILISLWVMTEHLVTEKCKRYT